MIEFFLIEGILTGHLIQPTCKERGVFNEMMVLRAPSSLALNVYIHCLSGLPVPVFQQPH